MNLPNPFRRQHAEPELEPLRAHSPWPRVTVSPSDDDTALLDRLESDTRHKLRTAANRHAARALFGPGAEDYSWGGVQIQTDHLEPNALEIRNHAGDIVGRFRITNENPLTVERLDTGHDHEPAPLYAATVTAQEFCPDDVRRPPWNYADRYLALFGVHAPTDLPF